MTERWNRPGGLTEKKQGRALGSLVWCIGLSGGGTLAAALLLPGKRGASLVCWIPITLGLWMGRLLFHRLRRGGKVAQMSGTKLLYFGLAALAAAGVMTGLCGLLPPLLCLPMLLFGMALTALHQGEARAEKALSALALALPREKVSYDRTCRWGGLGLVLILVAGYTLAAHFNREVLLLHLLSGIGGPVFALAGAWLLDRRLCLTDQRGAELRRETDSVS